MHAQLGAVLVVLSSMLVTAATPTTSAMAQSGADSTLVRERNIGQTRNRATPLPRSEGDQALVDGWPLYRTERGQAAFNDAMATLKATQGPAPAAAAFKGCTDLACNIALPPLADGWLPAGRIWVSPMQYVLLVHSPRLSGGQAYRRRADRGMRYFVFHEFHNSSRNTDVFDTISSHRGSVFVPLYMSRQQTDAEGRQFVIVMQVAPYDVASIHAANFGSAGPGMEVAKNWADPLEPLQGLAGIVVATLVKTAAPHLQVVNHRGTEGLPMLRLYEQRLALQRGRPGASVALPFAPAPAQRMATATGRLADLITRRGLSPSVPLADRAFVPPSATAGRRPPEAPTPALVSAPTRVSTPPLVPMPAAPPRPAFAMSPLAAYLSANLATMKQLAEFAPILPTGVAAIMEDDPQEGVVYLLDAHQQVLGHIEAHQDNGAIVPGLYVYLPLDRVADDVVPFRLDFSKPVTLRSAALGPARTGPPEPPRRAGR